MRRFIPVAVLPALLALTGCVEGQQTITINPDGSGKIRIEAVMTPPSDFMEGMPRNKQPDPDPIATVLRQSVRQLLSAQQAAAWKDVAAEFAPDGRLKFAGTVYFKKLDDLEVRGNPLLGSPTFGVTVQPGGALVIAAKKDNKNRETGGLFNPDRPDRKTPAELAKMTDAEVDRYILRDRIEYQGSKPILVALMTDAKVKTVFVLPGEVSGVKGLTAEGKDRVSFVLDGPKVLAGVGKIFAMSNAELRAVYRSKDIQEVMAAETIGLLPDTTTTAMVAKPTGPLFDFDKEVKEAIAAYPELRKRFKLDPNVRLPGEEKAK
jgi:hypothetical protein